MKLRVETYSHDGTTPFDLPLHTCRVFAPIAPYGRYIEVADARSVLSAFAAKETAIARAKKAVSEIAANQQKTVEYINI